MISLPRETDSRGTLTYVEENDNVPFDISRIFYIYGVPKEETVRGEHAHEKTEQVLITVHGSCKVTVKDGEDLSVYTLDDPATGLYVPEKTWTELTDFSENTVVLVLASTYYDPDEYIHDYRELN